jgi:arylsulfatase A-like enzyme
MLDRLTVLLGTLLVSGALQAQINVLIIVADDVGVDMIGAYAEHPAPPPTPVIDQLAAQGMLFRNCWSNPTCSPTRATILTGRYSFRTGIGRAIVPNTDTVELSKHEKSLPDGLPHVYTSLALGKWHLSINGGSAMALPSQLGFAHHRGAPWNLPDSLAQSAYYRWTKSVNGQLSTSNVYATTDTVNDAIELIATTPQPWFIYLAFNAAHSPPHKPPAHLHSYDLPQDVDEDQPAHFKAMIEAMDSELGRLFATVDAEVLAKTLIVFVGDNGTDVNATTAPFVPAHAKASLYEGGVNVPLIIKGAGVLPGTECGALVNTVDIYTTALEYAVGSSPPGKDGVSMAPYFSDPSLPSLRPWVYAESFKPNGFGPYIVNARAARDERYKLIRDEAWIQLYGGQSLYDLVEDPWETTNLLDLRVNRLTPEAQQSYLELSAVLDSLQGPWKDLGHDLGGVQGKPDLYPGGTLLPGDMVKLTLKDAKGFAPATLCMGLQTLYLPFKGGVVVPDPTGPGGQLLTFVTGGAGKLVLGSPWPAGVPGGLEIFFQFWIVDAAATLGFSASNSVRALTQ